MTTFSNFAANVFMRVGIVALALGLMHPSSTSMPSVHLVATCSGPPGVVGISPSSGRVYGGTAVSVTGCGFTGATAVKFGSFEAYGFTVDSDLQVRATSPGQAAGAVDVTVTTASGTSTLSPADVFTYNGPCIAIGESTTPMSPKDVGTQVAIAATASPCPNPLFRFELLPPGSQIWEVKQDWSTAASYNWDTASLPPGRYTWITKARDASSAGDWEQYAPDAYDLTPPTVITPCSVVFLVASPASPQQAGTAESVVADPVVGCPSPRFQFEVLAAGSQTWLVAEAYSASNSYNWDTSSHPAGVYKAIVKARDASSHGSMGSGNPNGSWDAYALLSFSITNGAGPCAGVTASPAPASPQNMGTGVTITSSATGCPTGARYQFEMQAPGSQVWQVVRGYTTTSMFNWNTSRLFPGMYRFIIKAEDEAFPGAAGVGNSNGSWDVYTTLTYTLSSTACTGVTASSSPPNTASSGTLVILTGNASGCPNPQYQFELNQVTNWDLQQPYGPENSMYWVNTRFVCSCQFILKARDADSPGLTGSGNDNGSWDAYVVISYTLA